jgi:hypothetical protein
MFLSANQLEREMGVYKSIGQFFVDRKPPSENKFWEKRLLYIGRGSGFLFMPVYYDILFRIGIPTELLLDEKHIYFMEQIMHISTLHELREISTPDELQYVRALLSGRVKDASNYELLSRYLDQTVLKPIGPFGLPYPSLNRADLFLYILCDLPLNQFQWEQAVNYWYALISSYLTQDDIKDYEKDKADGEENVILDLGDGVSGFEKAFDLLKKNTEILEQINPALARFLKLYIKEHREHIPSNIT